MIELALLAVCLLLVVALYLVHSRGKERDEAEGRLNELERRERARVAGLRIECEQGGHTRWRWYIRSPDNVLVAQGPPNGVDTPEEAESAARRYFGRQVPAKHFTHGQVVKRRREQEQ